MTGIIGASIALAIWSASASSPFDSLERIAPEMAAQRAAQCGLGPVKVRYEDELQSHVLTVADAASATEGQLGCLDKAAGWGVFVELPPSLQPRFDAVREARASEIMVAEARQWLSTRGLLDRVPKYVQGITDEAAFTRDVERLCGPEAERAFQSQYGFHALSPDWIKNRGMPPKREAEETMSCLMAATIVAGFKVGFIGNEAYGSTE